LHSAPPAIWKFRYCLHRSFHRCWLFLLNCAASSYLSKMPVSNNRSISTVGLVDENKRYQENLSHFFVSFYQSCLPCKSSCCTHMEKPPPIMILDYLLFGIYENGCVHLSHININAITERIANILKIGNRRLIKKSNYMRCPRLTNKGCSLPWGQRPTVCVILLCQNFCKVMTWQEYWHFMLKCTSYLFFLTKSFYKLTASRNVLGSAQIRICTHQ
jgi:hypothetical protein